MSLSMIAGGAPAPEAPVDTTPKLEILNKQIAGDLGTVEATVKVHRGRMMEKMGTRTVAELVRLAEKAGIRPRDGPS